MNKKPDNPARNADLFIDNVTGSIINTARQIAQVPLWKIDFHSELQASLSFLAGSFKLCGVKEFPIQAFRQDGRNGNIDVAWFEGPKWEYEPGFRQGDVPVAVFEIDSGLRKKSVGKLLAVDAPFRFWVYYGKKEADLLLEREDPEGLIKLIRVERPEFKRLERL